MGVLEDKFRSVLSHCQAVGDLVEIYLEEEDLDRFSVGLVESVGQDTVCLTSIDPEGEPDGRIVTRLDEIIRIHFGNEYLEAVKVLHEARGKVYAEATTSVTDYGLLDIPTSLRYAREHRIVVSVQDFDKGTNTGYVADIGDEWIEIEPLQRNGRANGFLLMRTEDIVRVSVGGRREQARGFVHQARLGR